MSDTEKQNAVKTGAHDLDAVAYEFFGPAQRWSADTGGLKDVTDYYRKRTKTIDSIHDHLRKAGGTWRSPEELALEPQDVFPCLVILAEQGIAIETRDYVTWTAEQWKTTRGRTSSKQYRLYENAQMELA